MNGLWVQAQDGTLVNLDNCVAVSKGASSDFRNPDEFAVLATSASSITILASELTEEQADKLLNGIYNEIATATEERAGVVRSLRGWTPD